MTTCYGRLDDGQHETTCYCGRPVKFHVFYGTGCGNVCGIHRRTVIRRKRSNVVTVPPIIRAS